MAEMAHDSFHNPGEARNPYRSPAATCQLDRVGGINVDGPIARLAFGLWAGVLFGGSFGAGGSVVLGIFSTTFLGWTTFDLASVEQFVVTEVVAAIAGAVCGLMFGSVIGPLTAAVCNLCETPRSWWAMALSVSLSIVAGSVVGYVGGKVLSGDLASLCLGVVIGAVSGGMGGWVLGRGILGFSTVVEHP